MQVSVELEGEGRPRRLSVVIRRVDIIPIASLQRFMRGQDEDLAYHALQVGSSTFLPALVRVCGSLLLGFAGMAACAQCFAANPSSRKSLS